VRIVRAGAVIGLCSIAVLASAAEQSPLTGGRDIIQAPGIGRVVAAFVIVAALAVAAVVTLRRVLPKMTGVAISGQGLRVLDRANLGPGTRVYLVQVEGEKVLVAESRSSVTIAVLGKAGSVVQS
jgi:flagellar biogenesis protein FliO